MFFFAWWAWCSSVTETGFFHKPHSLLALFPPCRVSISSLTRHRYFADSLVFSPSFEREAKSAGTKMLHMWFPFCVSMSHDESATLGGTAEGVQSSPISSFPAARIAHPPQWTNFRYLPQAERVFIFSFQHSFPFSRTATAHSFFQPVYPLCLTLNLANNFFYLVSRPQHRILQQYIIWLSLHTTCIWSCDFISNRDYIFGGCTCTHSHFHSFHLFSG